MDDIDRIDLEGVVVDPGQDPPYTSEEEAREAVDTGLILMREGNERMHQGTAMLALAERREAWKVLGFASWDECLVDGIGKHLRTTVAPAARASLAIQLRSRDKLSTRTIATAFDVSHSTIVRDLQIARDEGRLTGEPAQITSSNGRKRKSSVPTSTPRRTDLAKTWRYAVDDITRRTNTLAQLSLDDRYRERRQDLATLSRGDLQRAHAVLTAVLNDFDTYTTSLTPPTPHTGDM